MTETELIELFRRALRASLAVPLVAGAAGCSSTPAPRKADASTDSGHRADTGHGKDTGGGTHTSGQGDAGHDGGGQVDAGRDVAQRHDSRPSDARSDSKPHADASDSGRHRDGEARDARRDTGIDAKPDTYVNCTPAVGSPIELYFPASCLDGSLQDGDLTACPQCPAVGPNNMPHCLCSLVPPAFDGSVETFQCLYYCDGRAYAGMQAVGARQGSPLGRFFAASAHAEAASIDAFRILRDGFRAHDAPRELSAAAEAAARDEVRHARVTRRLARRFGGEPPKRPRAGARAVRPLAEVAEENAVEGCVRETYAALAAHHRSLVAEDGEVREAMAAIAEDETRHAALAWGVAAWAEPRLDAEAKARVRAARAAAVRELREAVGQKVPASLTEVAGVPAAGRAVRMLAVLERELWGGEGE